MEVRVHRDPGEFWSVTRPLYSADPVRHTVALIVLRRMLDAPDPDEAPPVLTTFRDGARVVGAAFRTPPYPMGVSALPEGMFDAVARAILEIDPELPGVIGPREVAEGFSEVWAVLTGATVKQSMTGRLYRLAGLEPPAVPGRARVATKDDVALLTVWRRDFEIAAVGYEREPGRAESQVRRVMAMGSGVLLWEVDGQVVSQAVGPIPIDGMSRISAVYTPPELRGRGYGSAVTAAASRWALDAGAENVLLFTDLANPVSNSIYQRIGYRPVHDTAELEFHK